MAQNGTSDHSTAAQGGTDTAFAGGKAALRESPYNPAQESGIDSVTFNLKSLDDCKFLFGKCGEAVYLNAHNQAATVSLVTARYDKHTKTITLSA